jgi:hypothetical protein
MENSLLADEVFGSYYILVSRKASMSQGICNRTVIEHSWVSGEH